MNAPSNNAFENGRAEKHARLASVRGGAPFNADVRFA
jgi:hypothetical protein